MAKVRLDILVQRTAGVSRSKAQGLIHTGKVTTAAGERLDKPGQQVEEDTPLQIDDGPRFVSRGGEKLEAAFQQFPFNVTGRIAIDAGASTGGFTDCLLQHEARLVYAVDVGYGQLDWRLRQDKRVVVMERTNIRNVNADAFAETPEVFTADCSFISLKLVLPPLLHVMAPACEGVVLIKPQFEAGKEQVGKGGVVRDDDVRQAVVDDIARFCETVGLSVEGVIPSPLLGPAGNREF